MLVQLPAKPGSSSWSTEWSALVASPLTVPVWGLFHLCQIGLLLLLDGHYVYAFMPTMTSTWKVTPPKSQAKVMSSAKP